MSLVWTNPLRFQECFSTNDYGICFYFAKEYYEVNKYILFLFVTTTMRKPARIVKRTVV